MALIKCSECGKEISDTATICPNCGVKTESAINKSQKTKSNIIITTCIIIIIAIIGISFYFIYASNPLNKLKNEAISILNDYKNDELSRIETKEKLEVIHDEASQKYDDNVDLENKISFNGFIINLSSITWDLTKGEISDTAIDEYISELRGF